MRGGGLILPSSLTVLQKAAVATLCTLWGRLWLGNTDAKSRRELAQHGVLLGPAKLKESGLAGVIYAVMDRPFRPS
jgi:hypothetical protein